MPNMYLGSSIIIGCFRKLIQSVMFIVYDGSFCSQEGEFHTTIPAENSGNRVPLAVSRSRYPQEDRSRVRNYDESFCSQEGAFHETIPAENSKIEEQKREEETAVR
jgi:hypothetical protein